MSSKIGKYQPPRKNWPTAELCWTDGCANKRMSVTHAAGHNFCRKHYLAARVGHGPGENSGVTDAHSDGFPQGVSLERVKEWANGAAEEWKEIPGSPGYRVSSWGRVWADGLFRHARQSLTNGYAMVSMGNIRGRKSSTVHRIVAETFLGLSDLPVVNHKDSCRFNNTLGNLEYVTQLDNIKHAVMKGKFRPKPQWNYMDLVGTC